jgi:hypothetical protein
MELAGDRAGHEMILASAARMDWWELPKSFCR